MAGTGPASRSATLHVSVSLPSLKIELRRVSAGLHTRGHDAITRARIPLNLPSHRLHGLTQIRASWALNDGDSPQVAQRRTSHTNPFCVPHLVLYVPLW